MAQEHKVSIKDLKTAGIEAKKGAKVMLQLGQGKVVDTIITKVEKDSVIVTQKQ